MKIAGLDIGTTGCKCTVFDEDGKEILRAYRDYPVKRGTSGHEIDAGILIDSVYACLSEVTKDNSDIAGIGVTSFGETFVMVDENGKPLANSMLYTDPRGYDECKELCEMLGEENIARITGVVPAEMYGIPKMMWMKRNRPEVFEKCKYIFQMEDFVVFSLTGKRQIDYSLATRSMGFNINTLSWDKTIFDLAGIDVNLMSEPVPTGTDAGCITKEVALKTGLSEDTHVVSISHDQVAAAVGAGAFSGNVGVDGAGTVQCLTPIYDKLPDVKKMIPGKYAIVPYVIKGKYVTYAFSYTGGAIIQWCTSNITKQEKELAKAEGISVESYLENEYKNICIEEGRDPEGPSGLLVLPHFAGAATPYMDSGSKGAIVGLTTSTRVAEIYRACMEGVVYEMYLNYKNVLASGAAPEKLHATGGGAHSKVWMQMKADVLGIPIVALNTIDAGTVGSAMLTGIAIGVFSDLDDAREHMVEASTVYEPRSEYHDAYMRVYERYERLYDAVRELV